MMVFLIPGLHRRMKATLAWFAVRSNPEMLPVPYHLCLGESHPNLFSTWGEGQVRWGFHTVDVSDTQIVSADI